MTHVEVTDGIPRVPKKERPPKKAPDPLLIDDFDAGKEIAEQLIPRYYPDLAKCQILYHCRNKPAKAAGQPLAAQIRKANPTERHLAQKTGMEGADYVLTVALPVWGSLQPNQRVALIDHHLARGVAEEDEQNGSMKYKLRPPTAQEFPEIAARHGRWNEGLVELGDRLKGK